MEKGVHTAFSDWKFIHRARINVLANNGRPWNKKDRSCRKCGHKNESLNHILNSCRPNLTQETKRHDAIITEIARALPAAQLRLNKQVPGSRFNLRPDIVLLDESSKRACILDVQSPFDLYSDSLLKARKAKTEKYQCVAEDLRNKGLRVYTRSVIIGSLGSFDGDNFRSFAELGIPKRQNIALAKKLVSQTIRHSRTTSTSTRSAGFYMAPIKYNREELLSLLPPSIEGSKIKRAVRKMLFSHGALEGFALTFKQSL